MHTRTLKTQHDLSKKSSGSAAWSSSANALGNMLYCRFVRRMVMRDFAFCMVDVLLLCDYQPGGNITTGVTEYGYPSITFTLHFRRLPLYYIANLIVPCGLLSFIAVVTFLLQPGCTERLGLGVSLYSELLFVSFCLRKFSYGSGHSTSF